MPAASVPDVADVAAAVLDETGISGLDPETAVAVLPTSLPAVPAQTTAAEPVPVGAVTAPPPEPAAQTPVEAAPTADPTPDAPPAAAVAQADPTNVNVSVRVDSPGDDGTVEQVNVAAAATETQYQPEPEQYQDSIPAPEAPAADPAVQPSSAGPTGEWDWTWNWNCGDPAPEIPVPAEAGTQNWTWIWNWNCGDSEPSPSNSAGNNAQYQPTMTQYRPININVSIRINSPGNNGNVVQTNVAVAVTPPMLPQVRAGPAPTSSGQSAATSGGSGVLAPLVEVAAVFDLLGAEQPEPVSEESACCETPVAKAAAGAVSEPKSVLLPEAPPAAVRALTPQDRFEASVEATIRLAQASKDSARRARPAPQRPQLRPATRRPAAPAREQAAALSTAGFAPTSATDGRLGTLVFLVVAFAFAIAFADASRSVAAEVRAAGEDPDPPPDRPG